jgi:asparagine synthase (glutamine-hydrolysing)
VSAIAGIVRLDGAACDQPPLDALARLLAHRSQDGSTTWRSGEAGLVYGRLTTTPESASEPQPLVDAAANTAIVFDGRLDNRDALFDAAGIAAGDRAALGDAEIVLRTYAALGADCVDRLLGDFAFAIWDRRARRLVCARDAFGVKPFCYRTTGRWIAFASEAGALARFDGGMPPVNEGMIAEHLAGVVTSRTETLFEGILRLPAAHRLVADANGIRTSQYWAPDLTAELKLANAGEYVDQVRELVERAVAARLRVGGGVAVSLSGGLDSSSITGVAASLCARRAVAASHVSTFSLVGEGIDEGAYSNQVAERWRLDATNVPVAPLSPGALADEARLFGDVPNTPNAAYTDRLRQSASSRGLHVVLNGGGADDWFGISRANYADQLKQLRIASLAHRLRLDAREEDFMGWPAAAKATIWPVVPGPIRSAARLLLRRGRTPDWIDRGFAARTQLRERLERHAVPLPYSSHERYDTWHQSVSGAAVHHYEQFERSSARAGVDTWFPFFDRRVIEFGLAVPAALRWHDGRPKEVLRRAMAPYLPQSVADRRTNPAGTHLILLGLEGEGGRALFERMRIAEFGWVDAAALLRRFDRAQALCAAGDPRYHWLAITLWHVAAIELWARAMQPELCLNN